MTELLWPPADLPVWLCPPEHRVRLKMAGVTLCRGPKKLAAHTEPLCPLCVTRHTVVTTADWCCVAKALRVIEHESPPVDPWCMRHGLPTEHTRRACILCDQAMAEAKLRGWSGRTGHDSDCCHCEVCGLCKGTGRVCRDCWRCDAHPLTEDDPEAPACERYRWDRALRRERRYFVHSCWHPASGRWAA